MTGPLRPDPADLLGRVGRHWGWALAFGIITVFAGVIALAWPGPTLLVIAILFGAELVVLGVFRFVAAFGHDVNAGTRVLYAFLGVLSLIIGLYALRHVLVTLLALALLLGIFWVINGAHNLCYVHPAQAGIRSNLNLITASGHVYSFLLTEISNQPNAEPDLKIFIEPKEGSGIAVSTGLRGYVSAGEAEAYKKELETLRSQTADQIHAAQAQSADQLNLFRSSYATKLQFDYPLDSKAGREPFLVSAIYHDDSFTYIKCGAREKPALYEIKDGKPNLISFQFENGVYIAPKIIDTGYLAIGKKKLPFARRVSAN